MRANIIIVFILSSLGISGQEKSTRPDSTKELRLVGDVGKYESIADLLCGLSASSDEIWSAVNALAESKPTYPSSGSPGIAIGGPVAKVRVISKVDFSIYYDVHIYGYKSGLVGITKYRYDQVAQAFKRIELGRFKDDKTYSMIDEFIKKTLESHLARP